MNNTIYAILSGILIGTCMILPGVSGSVVAIMLGVYEWLIFLLNDKEYNNVYKIKKLLPLTIGIIIGIFIFGKILLIFYNKYTYQMMYTFMGLILGSIPMLINEIKNKNEKINSKYLLISLLISLILFITPKIFNIEIKNSLNFFNLFIGGFLYIAGKIIPGISSSFFLMILGLYEYILTIITNPLSMTINKLITLIPFIIGVIIGLYIFIKLINYLLNNHFSKTYSTIIGFILGSVFAIYPGIELSVKGALSFIMMVVSFGLVNKLSKK